MGFLPDTPCPLRDHKFNAPGTDGRLPFRAAVGAFHIALMRAAVDAGITFNIKIFLL